MPKSKPTRGSMSSQAAVDVNLTGPFLMCREFGKAMLGQDSGSIVNVASVAGLLGIADRAAYNASKHGLIGLTRTLAAEWGGRGVRVNAVCPGWVKTEMEHYGISVKETVRCYDLEMVDGVLVANLGACWGDRAEGGGGTGGRVAADQERFLINGPGYPCGEPRPISRGGS